MLETFTELAQLEEIISKLGERARSEVIDTVHYQDLAFPIHCVTLGSMSPDAPVLAFFGGVHGIEKIGSEVLLAYLETLCVLLEWDDELQLRLEKSRLVFVPIVNPVGVYLGTRANGNCVDLMRNSPVVAEGKTKLYSGHRLTPLLPWYCGDAMQMEREALALCRVVREQVFPSARSIVVDLHSGFGLKDRFWFPYASKKSPYPYLAETLALKQLFDRCYPNHIYKIEPMCLEYLINGDLWDYLLDEFVGLNSDGRLFLPFTLEMGSWLWLRKNPTNLLSRHGLFHPLLPHRLKRVFRRHNQLFEFLHRALLNPQPWADFARNNQAELNEQAIKLWYG
jgi:Zinc carboxypeptidase